MTTAFEPRLHRLARVIRANARVKDLVCAAVPEYAAKMAVADRAKSMIAELNREIDPPAPMPSSVEDVTDGWLTAEVDRRVDLSQREARIQVLRELRFYAAEEAHDLLDGCIDELLRGLAQQLDRLVETAAAAVAEMDADVHTAGDAIKAGQADEWKAITELVPAYDDIRAAQRLIYQSVTTGFDRARCGDSPNVSDPEARLYFHRHLDLLTEGWHTGEPMPWPNDPAERLVWCVRNDSGAWVPTPKEINEQLATEKPEVPDMAGVSITRRYDAHGTRRNVDDLTARVHTPPPAKPHLLIQRG